MLDLNATVCRDSPSIPDYVSEYNPDKVIMMWVIAAVDTVYTVACVVAFWYFQRMRRYEHLRLRPLTLVVFLALMNSTRSCASRRGLTTEPAVSFIVYGPLGIAINHANIPCAVDLLFIIMIIPLGGKPVVCARAPDQRRRNEHHGPFARPVPDEQVPARHGRAAPGG
jgi:hypothetical protein